MTKKKMWFLMLVPYFWAVVGVIFTILLMVYVIGTSVQTAILSIILWEVVCERVMRTYKHNFEAIADSYVKSLNEEQFAQELTKRKI